MLQPQKRLYQKLKEKRHKDVDGVFDDPNDVYYIPPPPPPTKKKVELQKTLGLVCFVWVGWFQDIVKTNKPNSNSLEFSKVFRNIA